MRRPKPLLLTLSSLLFLGFSTHTGAAGPAQVAKADPHLWPEAVNSPAAFDKASRASILAYALALQDMQKLSDSDMLTAFKIKSVNRASVAKWLSQELKNTQVNYQHAAETCAEADWTCVGATETSQALLDKAADSNGKLPPPLRAWRAKLDGFTHAYLAEQLRLAALFPKVSSEIDRFNDREWTGDSLPDRQFFLSFDDGPSAPNGNSDDTLAMLKKQGKSAVFFVLGENLKKRVDRTKAATVASLYQGQCVASHGWEHQSHAKWGQWQDSIKRTQALLQDTLAEKQVMPLFRPPYGQRKADSGAFFEAQGLHVALWNLDSQDWNSHVTPDDIQSRMLTLMLIKRHGVMLFHDVHPKAKTALPVMFEEVGDAVAWGDCAQLRQL